MASWRRSDFRSYINAVRETFVRLGGKELEGNILRKLGKGWHAGFHGDLCSWSEACGGGQRWPGRKWGKKTRKGKLLRPFHENKEEGKSEKGREALMMRVQGEGQTPRAKSLESIRSRNL